MSAAWQRKKGKNPKGGLNFRIGLSPIYINIEGIKATLNYPYLSIGVLF